MWARDRTFTSANKYNTPNKGEIKGSDYLKQAISKLRKSFESAKFGIDYLLLRKDKPHGLGLVITDECNFKCIHCRVANTYHMPMSYKLILQHLTDYYNKGSRFLYLEGGEPFLWKDGDYRINDIVAAARLIGYLRVHIYTNGTFPINAGADFNWVSIDGLDQTYRKIRGGKLAKIAGNVHGSEEKIGIIYTVNTVNFHEIQLFLAYASKTFPKIGVMFFFHTPYYGRDYLLLSHEQKAEAIATIMKCKSRGMRVMNSSTGLNAILTGNYEHPAALWYVVDVASEYECCRAKGIPGFCDECCYASCAEMMLARNFKLGTIKEILGFY